MAVLIAGYYVQCDFCGATAEGSLTEKDKFSRTPEHAEEIAKNLNFIVSGNRNYKKVAIFDDMWSCASKKCIKALGKIKKVRNVQALCMSPPNKDVTSKVLEETAEILGDGEGWIINELTEFLDPVCEEKLMNNL